MIRADRSPRRTSGSDSIARWPRRPVPFAPRPRGISKRLGPTRRLKSSPRADGDAIPRAIPRTAAGIAHARDRYLVDLLVSGTTVSQLTRWGLSDGPAPDAGPARRSRFILAAFGSSFNTA